MEAVCELARKIFLLYAALFKAVTNSLREEEENGKKNSMATPLSELKLLQFFLPTRLSKVSFNKWSTNA